MKKFAKVCLILAGAAAGIGVILCVVGVSMGANVKPDTMMKNLIGWSRVTSAEAEDWEDAKEIESELLVQGGGNYDISKEHTQEIENLEIDLKAGSLVIKESSDEQIHITVNSVKGEVKVDASGKTLSLSDKTGTRSFWSGWFHSSRGGIEMTLSLPADKVFNKISIEVAAGKADLEQYTLEADSVKLNIDAGELKADGLKAREMLMADVGTGELGITSLDAYKVDLDCGIGELNLQGTVAGDLTADCGVGEMNITLSDEESSFDYVIDCGIGEVNIAGNSYSSMGVSRRLDNGAEKKMELDCGVGSIRVQYR